MSHFLEMDGRQVRAGLGDQGLLGLGDFVGGARHDELAVLELWERYDMIWYYYLLLGQSSEARAERFCCVLTMTKSMEKCIDFTLHSLHLSQTIFSIRFDSLDSPRSLLIYQTSFRCLHRSQKYRNRLGHGFLASDT